MSLIVFELNAVNDGDTVPFECKQVKMRTEAPNPGQDLLLRENLWARLDAAARGRAVFIHAPGGYGKTSLLAQWAMQSESRAGSVRWLSLEEGDSDEKTFLIKLAIATENSSDTRGLSSKLENLSVDGLHRLIAERFFACETDLLVVCDDYHLVESDGIDGFLGKLLLDRAFRRHCLIVLSRTRPSIPVGKLWIDSQLTSLNARDLLMSEEEVAAIFTNATQSQPALDVKSVYQKTEGWAVAVRMAKLIVDQKAGKQDPLAEFDGKQADVAHYLAEHLTADLVDEDMEFLLLLSPLKRFDVELAQYVTGVQNATDRFSRLERLGVPLTSLDGNRNWLRLHPVFQDFLLAQAFPNGVSAADVLTKAAQWFQAGGDIESAVGHAISSGNYKLAAEFLENAGGWRLLYAGAGGIRRFLPQIVSNLSETDYPVFPRTLLGYAVMFAKDGDLISARQEYNRITRLRAGSDDLIDREFRLIGQLLALYNDIPISRDEFAQLESDLGTVDRDAVENALTLNIMCFYSLEFSELDNALDFGAMAIKEYRRADAFFGEAHLHTHVGQAYFMKANIAEARKAYGDLREFARKLLGDRSDLEAMAQALDAEALVESGDFAGAAEGLSWALAQLESGDCWFDILAAAYLALLRLHTIQGQSGKAHKVLDKAEAVANSRRYERLARLVDRERVYLLANAGMTDDARILATMRGLDENSAMDAASNDLGQRLRGHVPALLWARIHHAEGSHDQALRHLDTLLSNQNGVVSPLRRLRLEILKIRFLLSAGLNAEADRVLEELLLFPMLGEVRASFMEEGSEVFNFLQQKRSQADLSQIATNNLLSILQPVGVEQSSGGNAVISLTDRELSVLKLVDTGLSNKEIARALAITENTIKFHLKNVFQKLDCTNRTSALSGARKLGLFDQ
jgi:LuxR family maltose regulon positive regulatory protein